MFACFHITLSPSLHKNIDGSVKTPIPALRFIYDAYKHGEPIEIEIGIEIDFDRTAFQTAHGRMSQKFVNEDREHLISICGYSGRRDGSGCQLGAIVI